MYTVVQLGFFLHITMWGIFVGKVSLFKIEDFGFENGVLKLPSLKGTPRIENGIGKVSTSKDASTERHHHDEDSDYHLAKDTQVVKE